MPTPKIAIIGAGPAGLSLARLLQQASLPITIYEASPSRNNRDQGGTLDLHPKGGQAALEACGLLSEFKKHSRPEGEATKIVKYDGGVLWDDNETWKKNEVRGQQIGRDRPEIDRVRLRDILLDSLALDTVQWNKKLIRVAPSAGEEARTRGNHDLYFSDNSVETGVDLVVGADGAWSKVRPLLTDEKPFYSGITALELWALDVEERNPWLSGYVGKGSLFMFDEGRALICQRNGNGSVRAYAAVRVPETWVGDCGIDWESGDTARERLVKEYFGDCGEDLKRVILESKDEMIPRKMWMLPVGVEWESKPGVTLLGDAAHLMTPFAGVGVNVAMADALELARALIARKDSLVAKAFSDGHNIAVAVKQYETTMLERGRQNAEKTWENMQKHFSKDGGEERVAKLRKHSEEMKKAAELEKAQATA